MSTPEEHQPVDGSRETEGLGVFAPMRPCLILMGILLVALIGVTAFRQRQPDERRIAKIAAEAVQKKDPSRCDTLPERIEAPPGPEDGKGLPYVSYPRDRCLLLYLEATKDRRVCDMLDAKEPGSGAYCYRLIADAHRDPSACQKLEGAPDSWKSVPICIAVAKRDARACDVLAEREREFQLQYAPKTDCILEVVRRTKDDTACAGITGPGYGSLDAEGADADRNRCLKIAGCDKPEKRAEICALMKYPSYTLPEKKAQCLTETWTCPEA